jgi:hypothetical protein
MAQLFRPRANTIAKTSLMGLVIAAGIAAYLAGALQRSTWATEMGVPRQQPVPFSHEHHVRGLGLDCRYCHTTVEKSSFAGMPPTQTCMTCHSQLWTNAELLKPVRESWRTGVPLQWTRVHNLPGYVYFDHSIHVNKGIGCSTCHGQVDQMPLVWQTQPLQMGWCLQCHRQPEQFIRPRDQVFNMDWQPPANQLEMGKRLVEEYGIRKEQLTNCSVCHR